MQRKLLTPSNALTKLQDLCARSEQCSYEVLVKLRGWGIDELASKKILALLKRERYVDDRRFAEAFVRDKVMFNRWGRVKIKLALIQKHIDHDTITGALGEIDADEYKTAIVATLRTKARTMPDVSSYESRTKLLKYCVSRGFEVNETLSVLKDTQLWAH